MAEAKNIYVYGGVDYSKWEEATLQLISEFYNSSLYDPQAKDKFRDGYSEFQKDIEESTKAKGIGVKNTNGDELNGPGVNTYEEADAVLDVNKINEFMSKGRRAGLLTGVNPQYFERYRASGLSTSDKLVRKVFGGLFTDASAKLAYDPKIQNAPSSAADAANISTMAQVNFTKLGISLITLPVLEFLRRKYIELSYKEDSPAEGDELATPVTALTEIINAVEELYSVYLIIKPELDPSVTVSRPENYNQMGLQSKREIDRLIKDNENYKKVLDLINRTRDNPTDPSVLEESLLDIGKYRFRFGSENETKRTQPALKQFFGELIFQVPAYLGGGALDDNIDTRPEEERNRYGVLLGNLGNPNFRINTAVINLFNFFRPRIDEIFTGDGARYGGDDVRRINRELNYILGWFGTVETEGAVDNPLEGADVTDIEDADLQAAPVMPAPNLKPFDFQCFLLENISKLHSLRTTGNSEYRPNYKNLIQIDSNGDPGLVQNKIQAGGHSGGYVKQLLDICPEAYALLTPYLKISRIVYDDKGKIKMADGKPVVQDLRIPNFLTENQMKRLLSPSGGRVPGAGIKSFSWSLDGVQPAEVDNNITAELVIYFQSVGDFFQGARQAGAEQPNFLDLIINSESAKEEEEKGSDKDKPKNKPDEKACPDKLKKNSKSRTYEGKNFRVQITAGWSTPDKESFVAMGMNSSKAADLVKAIRATKTTLYLQMVKHQLNFQQNGSLELTVNYRASLAGVLSGRTSNILDQTSKETEDAIQGVKDKIDEVEKSATDSDTQKMRSTRKEEIKKLQEQIANLRSQDRNLKYKKLLAKLFNVSDSGGAVSGTRIFSLSVNPYELSLEPYSELTPTQRAARIERKRTSQTFTTAQVGNINSEVIKAIDDNKSANGKDLSNIVAEANYKTFKELAKQNRVNIPFFYLGDLFDAVLEQIKENYPDDLGPDGLNFKFFLSDVEMIDPLQAFKIDNLDELIDCGYSIREIARTAGEIKTNPNSFTDLSGIFKTMNIGDIPISLDTFQVWFKNNVIKNERDKYFFLYFVKDVCKDLISKALSSKCFGDDFNFDQRFDAKPLTMKTLTGGKSRFSPKKIYPISALASARNSIYESADPLNTELAFILYSTDSKPHGLTGKDGFGPGCDGEKGIYHHYLGSACGLVKTINFQREDQAYQRESRIQKNGTLGAEQLRELYSVNMDLVGNNLYTNGVYIYVNPSLLGASTRDLNYLGLHGYYLVTKVQSKVTPSTFDVSIRALQEGITFEHQALQPSSLIVSDAPHPEDPPPEFGTYEDWDTSNSSTEAAAPAPPAPQAPTSSPGGSSPPAGTSNPNPEELARLNDLIKKAAEDYAAGRKAIEDNHFMSSAEKKESLDRLHRDYVVRIAALQTEIQNLTFTE